MYPVLFRLPGGHPIYSYGAMLGLSICVGYFVSSALAERHDGFPDKGSGWLYAVTIASAIVGSRVLYIVTNLDRFSGFLSILRFSDGGLVAYGGFLGGFVGGWAYCRAHRLSILAWGDAAVPSMALGLGITRIGCFLYGCDYGQPWRGPWAITFPFESPAYNYQRLEGLLPEHALRSLPVHPSQLYESLVGFLLFGFTMWVWSRRRQRGEVLVAFTMGYGALRFCLELVRGDDQRGGLWGLSTSQFIGIVTFVAAGILWAWLRRKEPERG
ncbi:MAG: prolipoprotein diacylglyceryl transferase [Polyangia bacterium]